MSIEATVPLENFIQAVQNQLDKAQTAMAVKARNLNLPMTFAVKDINLDLRAHVELTRGEIRIRPAGANEPDASVFHLVFTAITRPMIEENAVGFSEDPDEYSIDELEEELTDEERRKLEWVGIRTVKKLREMDADGSSRAVSRVANLKVSRLQQALKRSSAPMVNHVTPVTPTQDDPPEFNNILRVRGRNLLREGIMPRVTIDDRPASILKSSDKELLLAPSDNQWSGVLRVETEPEAITSMSFDLATYAPIATEQIPNPDPTITSDNGKISKPEAKP